MYSSLRTNLFFPMNEYERIFSSLWTNIFVSRKLGTNILKRNGMIKWPCVSKHSYLGMNMAHFCPQGRIQANRPYERFFKFIYVALFLITIGHIHVYLRLALHNPVCILKTPSFMFCEIHEHQQNRLGAFQASSAKIVDPLPLSFTWGDMKFTKIHFYKLQFTLIFFIKFYCKAMHIFSRLLLYQHRQYIHISITYIRHESKAMRLDKRRQTSQKAYAYV